MYLLRYLTFVLLLSPLFLLTGSTFAQLNNQYLERAGKYPYGPSLSVEVDAPRELIYMSTGGAVFILDNADPSSPVLLTDTLRSDGLVHDLYYDSTQQRLYIAGGEGGLEIWDVADPMNPERFSRKEILYFDVETPVEAVELYGNYAILSCAWGYVHSVNVMDPANPVQVGFNGTMGNPAREIHISHSDGMVHSSGAQRYQRLGIGSDGSLSSTGQYDFVLGPYEVFGEVPVAYVGYDGNLYILDLFHPGFLPWSITPVGGIADIMVRDTLAYIVNDQGLSIYNVADYQSPQLTGTVALRDDARNIMLSGDFAYVSIGSTGLDIVRIADPTNPLIVGGYDASGVTWDAHIDGTVAYVSHSLDGLYSIDYSNIDYPVALDIFPSNAETRDFDKQGNTGFIADWTGGLRIVDLSDPANMMEITTYGAGSLNTWRVAVFGDFAYVIDAIPNNPYHIRVLDISDMNNITERGSLTLNDILWDIEYYNGYLLISGNDLGLKIIDVSDPDNPAVAETIDLPEVFDVFVHDTTAYICANDHPANGGGLFSYSLADPLNPVMLDSYQEVGISTFHVSGAGEYIYVSDIFDIHVFLVDETANMSYLESYVSPGDMFNVAAYNEYLFIGDGSAGLQIARNVHYNEPGGGLTWREQNSNTTEDLQDVYFRLPLDGWIAGNSGTILRTTNGGILWNAQTTGTTADLFGIVAPESQVCYACGSAGTVLKTTDGGSSWSSLTNGTSETLNSIDFIDGLTGWAVGTNGFIMQTTDGGATWSVQNSTITETLHDVEFTDADTGYAAVSGFGTILKTTNGGQNWQAVTGISQNLLFAVDFVDDMTGFAVGSFGAIHKTIDGGQSWSTQTNPPPNDWLYSVHFPDGNNGTAVGFGGKIITTTDGGSSWESVVSGTTELLNDVFFADEFSGWSVGENGVILSTHLLLISVELTSFTASAENDAVHLEWSTASEKNNRGFEIERTFTENGSWEAIGFVKGRGTVTEKSAYSFIDNPPAGVTCRYRLKQIDYDGTIRYSDIVEVNLDVPSEYALRQNYPNPFNPSTTISFDLPEAADVEVTVYSVLGEEIVTIVKEHLNAGTYDFEFLADNIPSGVYIYRLKTEGFVYSKKMLLLK